MSRKIIIGVVVCLVAGALLSLRNAPIPLSHVISQPVQSLATSSEQLHEGVLEVSENMGVVQEATRRLLKPLGVVRLIRRFPTTPSSENTSSSNATPQP